MISYQRIVYPILFFFLTPENPLKKIKRYQSKNKEDSSRMFMPEMTKITTELQRSFKNSGYRKWTESLKNVEYLEKVSSSMDPRHDQLIVFSSVLEHLLQQKLHYEQERDMELIRLERFKREGAKDNRIRIQKRVVKRVQDMLPNIVFKMRNECDKFERFLHREHSIRNLDVELYNKAWKLLYACRETLKQTL